MGTKKPKRRSEVAPKKRALDYLASGRTQDALASVSYTHLTLPTILLV